MPRARKSKRRDPYIQQVLDVLREYQTVHPHARVEAYRHNPTSIRIRVIDPDFRKLDRVDRESSLWKILDQLPEDVKADITWLLLLTPEETKTSFANLEFENPLPSRL